MTVAPPRGGNTPPRRANTYESRDMAQLRLRRREARRKRGLLRLDVALGTLAAVVLLVVSPGVAFAALVAIPVLACCVVSIVLERRRARRR